MIRRGLAFAAVVAIVLSGPAAWAGTVGVVVEGAPPAPLPDSTFRSVVWHALYAEHGHHATFFDSVGPQVIPAMRDESLTTLVHLNITWRPDSVRIDDPSGETYLVGGHYPVILTTEYQLRGDALVATGAWRTEGPISVFRVKGETPARFVSIPEVTLQETTSHALRPVQAPVWTAPIDVVRVPIVLAADEEYRAFYGERGWNPVARRAVDRANAILSPAGLMLDVVGEESWVSPDGNQDLSALLDALHALPAPPQRAIRVGFTGQTRLAVEFEAEAEDVGRAHLPGREVLVADQAAPPGHDPAWDAADEGATVAHEVLHALGVPHLEEPDSLMAAVKRGTVHEVTPTAAALARAAAAARFTQWDRDNALVSLSAVAEGHLTDPELRLDFVSVNLTEGPGFPAPGTLQPQALSALSNLVVGRYYFLRAERDPQNAWTLRQGARAHVESALAQQPTWQEARQLQRLVQKAQATTPRADPRETPSRDEPPAPWGPAPWDSPR
jgi:hypothetical protein